MIGCHLQHPESQARVSQFHEWVPNILTDHHEMGTNSTFFFEPVHKNRFNQMTPKRTYEITAKIAEFHKQALDEIGSFYYTKESYDDFYVGYGSSYPDITGTIGLLFEQASSRGHLQESVHGDLSFPFTIRNQFRTSLSTVKAAYTLRIELNQHIRTFFRESFELAEEDENVAYILGSNDSARNNYLAELLKKHQIEVFNLKQTTRLNSYTFQTNRDLIIPLKQKQYRLIVSLFKNHLSFADSSFYDISTWNLAHSFNMKFEQLESNSRLADILGQPYRLESHASKLSQTSTYAYLMRWDSYNSLRAVHRLLKNEIIVKVAERGFSLNKQTYTAGTILIPISIQSDKISKIEKIRNQISSEDQIQFEPVHTGFTDQGIDLGSGNFATLKKIKALILAGSGTSSYDIGEIWHLTDTRLNLPLSIIESRFLNSMNLSDYNVIIMASGNYNQIEKSGIKQLKQWLNQGGTLITLSTANSWLNRSKLADIEFRNREQVNKEEVTVRRDYEKAQAFSAARAIGGSIFMADLDLSHPIGFGFEHRNLPYLKRGNTIIQLLKNPYNTPL